MVQIPVWKFKLFVLPFFSAGRNYRRAGNPSIRRTCPARCPPSSFGATVTPTRRAEAVKAVSNFFRRGGIAVTGDHAEGHVPTDIDRLRPDWLLLRRVRLE